MREQVIKLIEVLGISQTEFAKNLGISKGNISDLIKGRTKNLSAEALLAMYHVYGIDVQWLLTGEGKMFGNQDALMRSENVDEMEYTRKLKDLLEYICASFPEIPPEHMDQYIRIVKALDSSFFKWKEIESILLRKKNKPSSELEILKNTI